jgi:hypothetical protein
MENKQITTITILRFEGINAAWMFAQMGLALSGLRKVEGLKFFRLMGSGGKNGFSKLLNPNVYAFLGVWESEIYARNFFAHSEKYQPFGKRSKEAWTLFMHNIKAHGSWSGKSPFEDFQPYEGGLVAVVTRATIKLKHMSKFWSYVPAVSGKLEDQEGLIFSVGIGEYPWFMQATLSIWEDYSYMKQYAYKSRVHSEVIKKTRELGWYSEELFANFAPFDSIGTWEGINPLESIFSKS